MRLFVVGAVSLSCLATGCLGRGQDAHEPGDRLGTYHLTGKLASDSCKATVLGVTADWQFDVKLSRSADTLYWLNGEEAIPGTIAADGKNFDVESGVEVELETAHGARPGCTVERSDRANGELSSKSSDVRSFRVAMSFEYAATSESECSGYVGVEGGFASLPCSVSYDLTAKRTALPPPE